MVVDPPPPDAGAGDAGDGIEEDEDVLARFDEASAAFDGEAGEADMGFEVHVVGARHDLGLHTALEVGDFLGAFINEEHHDEDVGVVGGDGVVELLEDGGLAGIVQAQHQQPRITRIFLKHIV